MEAAQTWTPDLDEIRRAAEGRPIQPLAARFYMGTQENPTKSLAAGHPVFDDVEMIEIRISSQDMRDRPVTHEDKIQYARQYLAFKEGQSQEAAEGMPLGEWSLIKRGDCETLRMNGIRTVEHLAQASDARIQTLGPYMQLREHARDWLKQAKDGAATAQLRAENTELKARLSALEDMFQRQSREIEAARNAGGVLTTSAPDHRIAEMQAQIAALARSMTPTQTYEGRAADAVTVPQIIAGAEGSAKRKGGRPKGSKNKPKVPDPVPEG